MLSINAEHTLELIREKGVNGLCVLDGCVCGKFEVHRIHVDVSCRKSSGMSAFNDFYGIGIRVYSNSMDVAGEDLHAVALEMARQFEGSGYDIKVRLCSYEDDKKSRCIYCHKPRAELDAYLCEECMSKDDPFGESVAESHDYRRWEPRLTKWSQDEPHL